MASEGLNMIDIHSLNDLTDGSKMLVQELISQKDSAIQHLVYAIETPVLLHTRAGLMETISLAEDRTHQAVMALLKFQKMRILIYTSLKLREARAGVAEVTWDTMNAVMRETVIACEVAQWMVDIVREGLLEKVAEYCPHDDVTDVMKTVFDRVAGIKKKTFKEVQSLFASPEEPAPYASSVVRIIKNLSRCTLM